MSDFLSHIVESIVSGGVALFIAWWVTNRALSYGNLDTLYSEILGLYFDHPGFAQPALTQAYVESFSGEERAKYEQLAYRVFTFLETVYDTHKSLFSQTIDREWTNIFRLEVSRHVAWYRNNSDMVSPYFREFVDAELARLTPRTGQSGSLEAQAARA